MKYRKRANFNELKNIKTFRAYQVTAEYSSSLTYAEVNDKFKEGSDKGKAASGSTGYLIFTNQRNS